MIDLIKKIHRTEVGSFILLYLAFVVAGSCATAMLFGIFFAFPHLEPNALFLKADALTSANGPIALFMVWLAIVPLFIWNNCMRTIIVYYGKRVEEFAVVMFAAFMGSVLVIGLFGFGWKSLPETIIYTGAALFLSMAARFFAPTETRSEQALAALMAVIALGIFLTGPALWPIWFRNYVTL